MCRRFRVVPHCPADYADGDVFALCDAGPAVSGHVERQRGGEVEPGREAFEVAVDVARAVAVLVPFRAVLLGDQGQ